MARWRSSYAAVCKTVYTGANPVRASKVLKFARMVELVDTRDLKSLGHYGRAGSSPALRTKIMNKTRRQRSSFFVKNAIIKAHIT